MNRNTLHKVAEQAASVFRRLGAAVGSVQSSAHSKKELIELRHRRWAEFRRRIKTDENGKGE